MAVFTSRISLPRSHRLCRSFRLSHYRGHASSACDAAAEMLAKYKGKTLSQSQYLDPHQAQKLSLMLNRPELQSGVPVVSQPPKVGTPLPAGYHLVYLTPASVEGELGADGTDRTFNPPGRFTRRMWAGGSIEWKADNCLRVGDHVTEETQLLSATPKKSRSGHEMVLVDVKKEFANDKGISLVDRRSWIFQPEDMQGSRKGAGRVQDTSPAMPYKSTVRDDSSPEQGLARRHFSWSPAALFRFSALTYNGHMIHYSDTWCRDVEGFPGPVVHGPLNLINMLDLWRDVHGRENQVPFAIKYRALAPLYAGTTYDIHMGGVKDVTGHEKKCEVIVASEGSISMKADISF